MLLKCRECTFVDKQEFFGVDASCPVCGSGKIGQMDLPRINVDSRGEKLSQCIKRVKKVAQRLGMKLWIYKLEGYWVWSMVDPELGPDELCKEVHP